MLTAQSHGELLLASPLPQITDNASERLLPAGVVGAHSTGYSYRTPPGHRCLPTCCQLVTLRTESVMPVQRVLVAWLEGI